MGRGRGGRGGKPPGVGGGVRGYSLIESLNPLTPPLSPQGRGGSGYGNAVCNSCTPLRRGARRHESAGVLEPKLGYSVCRTSEKGGIAMAERHHADEGSKGGDRSILTFAIVAIALTVGLIVVGLRDKTVAPEAAQPTTEAPATPAPAAEAPATPAPAPSGSTP
jgi:hypothetical protein